MSATAGRMRGTGIEISIAIEIEIETETERKGVVGSRRGLQLGLMGGGIPASRLGGDDGVEDSRSLEEHHGKEIWVGSHSNEQNFGMRNG